MGGPGPVRVGREPWICVGHAALAMPPGYDAYVVFSRFQEAYQRHLPPEAMRSAFTELVERTPKIH